MEKSKIKLSKQLFAHDIDSDTEQKGFSTRRRVYSDYYQRHESRNTQTQRLQLLFYDVSEMSVHGQTAREREKGGK